MIPSRGLQPLNERMPTAIRKAPDFDARIPWPGHRLELRAFRRAGVLRSAFHADEPDAERIQAI